MKWEGAGDVKHVSAAELYTQYKTPGLFAEMNNREICSAAYTTSQY
jgi:hypothetical protein